VPVNGGNQRLRPIWFEDFGKTIVSLLERREGSRRTFEIAGGEVTTINDLIDAIREITARIPLRISIPARSRDDDACAPHHEASASTRRRSIAVRGSWPTFSRNASPTRASVPCTTNASGRTSAGPGDIMPIEFAAEPGAPSRIRRGATMTMSLPMRGHVQIRVEKDEPAHVVFATVEGHPIAGIVEFTARDLPGGVVRFEIDAYSRAASRIDFAALRTMGEGAQSANWRIVVQNVIDASGGSSDGVHVESRKLTHEQAARIEKDVRAMVRQRQRDESSSSERPA
jgi:hypothetical protein